MLSPVVPFSALLYLFVKKYLCYTLQPVYFPPIFQVVTNKYLRTLALVKQDLTEDNVDRVLEEDSLNLEAANLAKDDKDFKIYMGLS